MQRLSAPDQQLRRLCVLFFLCPFIFWGQACSLGTATTGSQHRAPQATVYYEEVADWSFEAAHPAELDPSAIKSVLSGLHVDDRSVQGRSADGGKPMRVFSDEDVQYLAPLLAHALSQAQPEYVVAFRLSSSAGSGSEPTAGTLYVLDQQLHLTLTSYQGRLGQSETSWFGPSSGAKTVHFIPEAAGRLVKAAPTVALGQRDLLTIAVDYTRLGKPAVPSSAERVASTAEHEKKRPERILLASAESDSQVKSDAPSVSVPDAGSRTEDELKAAQQAMARKDAKIDQLRRDLESMRRQLEAKDKELRQVKSKPASVKRDKRRTAELLIR